MGFGVNAVDHLVVVPAFPAFDTKTRLRAHLQAAGGQTASTLVGLRRLGLRTAYAGRVGSDAEGSFSLASLRDEGVNVEHAEVIDGARTQIAFIFIDEHSGERTVIWDRDARLRGEPGDAPAGFAAQARVLHLDAQDPAACVPIAREARAAGTIVSADLDNLYEGLPELLPLLDVLISSQEFPRRLTGIGDERRALVELKARYGLPLIGITRGEQGALVYHEETFLEAPALSVPGGCRDTTGAGAAFHAGFLYGLLQGEELEACLTTGCAVAALKCRDFGARAALPRAAELHNFLSGEGETS